jgi:hypothetical protein
MMNGPTSFPFPEQASNLAPDVDWIFYTLTAICGSMAFLVMALITGFCIRFRLGSGVLRTGDNSRSFP